MLLGRRSTRGCEATASAAGEPGGSRTSQSQALAAGGLTTAGVGSRGLFAAQGGQEDVSVGASSPAGRSRPEPLHGLQAAVRDTTTWRRGNDWVFFPRGDKGVEEDLPGMVLFCCVDKGFEEEVRHGFRMYRRVPLSAGAAAPVRVNVGTCERENRGWLIPIRNTSTRLCSRGSNCTHHDGVRNSLVKYNLFTVLRMSNDLRQNRFPRGADEHHTSPLCQASSHALRKGLQACDAAALLDKLPEPSANYSEVFYLARRLAIPLQFFSVLLVEANK